MSSVTMTWTGRIPDRAGRERLIAALEPFALASNALLPLPEPPLHLDAPVEGTVLILLTPAQRSRLTEAFRNREALLAALRSVGGTLVSSDWIPPASDELVAEIARDVGVPLFRRPDEYWFLRLPKANLHGIQWRICEPRSPFDASLTVGFVHLVIPELPLLDGTLFEVQGAFHHEAFDDPALGPADWRLSRPNVHLRYYLESWFERFLSWVRLFHVPDLRTEGYGDDVGWLGFERAARYRSRYERGRQRGLETRLAAELLAEFRREARSWGLKRPAHAAEADLTTENRRLSTLLDSADERERPRLLRALADGLQEQAELLTDWPGRESEAEALSVAAGDASARLDAERTHEDRLIVLAERHLADAQGTERDDEDEDTLRSEALSRGFATLSIVPAERRPPGLEAQFRLQFARKALAERKWAAALDAAEQAVSRWENADRMSLVAKDFAGFAAALSVAADARELLASLEECVERFRLGLERLRVMRAGVMQVSGEEAVALAKLGARQRMLGRTEDARATLRSAEASHVVLLRKADGSPWLWRGSRMEVLQHLAELETARGEPEIALRHLSTLLSIADEAGGRPVAALRLIAEIELGRGRFTEAAEAARDGLEAVYPVTVPPSADASALAEILREARRRNPRALVDAPVPGAPS